MALLIGESTRWLENNQKRFVEKRDGHSLKYSRCRTEDKTQRGHNEDGNQRQMQTDEGLTRHTHTHTQPDLDVLRFNALMPITCVCVTLNRTEAVL